MQESDNVPEWNLKIAKGPNGSKNSPKSGFATPCDHKKLVSDISRRGTEALSYSSFFAVPGSEGRYLPATPAG